MKRDDAASGTLLLKTTTPGCYLGAPRVAADISVEVAGPVARTRITQRFHNPAGGWVEGVYVFPMPEGAAVDTLRMKVGQHFIEGQIKAREEARNIYEQAKQDGKRASLVEEDRPNVFTNQVANIGPHETVTVQIEYQEGLPFEQGRYRLRVPLVVAPRYSPAAGVVLAAYHAGRQELTVADPVPDRDRLDAPVLRPEAGKTNPVAITVHLEAGFPLGTIESGSHAISVVRNGATGATIALKEGETPADRDFTLSFAAKPGTAPTVSLLKQTSGGEDYLLAVVVPAAADKAATPKPREVVFVLDNSGSMAGESIRQAKASLLLALDRLTPQDRFNVIRFDDTLTVLYPQPVAATALNLASAKGYVSGIDAAGGTEMLPALIVALNDSAPNDTSHIRQVVFLTDGEVGNEAELFAAIHNKLGRSRLFTVGIGSAPNAYFMAGAARAGRGTYTYVGSIDEVSARMAELFAKLERPVMTDLAAAWPDAHASEVWPNPLPDLYAGEPVVLTAQTNALKGKLVLSGKFEGRPWTQMLDLAQARAADGIEKLWARNKIASLEESRVFGIDADTVDKAVLQTALDHHLTSRLTSLVAVDVTPSRPDDAPLATEKVALNLPAGWDFDKVFGERPDAPTEADAVPQPLLQQLIYRPSDGDAVEPEDAHLVLPQGGTDSRLLVIIGATMFGFAFLLLRRNRTGAHR